MSGWHRTVSGSLLALAILLGSALAARAETPTYRNGNCPAPARKPADPRAQSQIMAQQIGFEAQQQGYVSKVQGAASQNIIWVTPEEKSFEPARRSWLAALQDFFSFD